VLLAAGALLVTAVVAGASGALAGGQTFTDVGPSHPFAEDIEAIAAAGITTGYADGTYRPGGTVSRGAMAAFMGRGFSRTSVGFLPLSTENTPAAIVPGSDTNDAFDVASVAITAGATEAGTGYVVASGTASLATFDDDVCPCQVLAYLGTSDGSFSAPGGEYTTLDAQDANDARLSQLAVNAVFEVEADTTAEYSLYVVVTNASGSGDLYYGGKLILTYVPFVEEGFAATVAGAANGGASTTSAEPPGALLAP
jgi:hypothetical protein